ncbi:SPOR domain-containing protein [Rhizobium tubonense]|uniref:Sporulation protein n=1 Tax=Rhizobium tubonense TaxID=484088 RepID=A0A2W4CEC7_9HYPH|nr:SPOR domain-containing protein [Rhizobium tubonense]PZM11171.1 sporulation protein [Rhizobium tubonense]
MAEKQLAYRTNGKDEIFAEDDPLAELARIVGFEPRSPAPATQRNEPAFDLEDELLREFERYDAPRLSPIDDISIEPEDEPLYGEAAYAQPGNENVPRPEPHHQTEPEFAELSLEDAAPSVEPEISAEAYEDAPTSEWVDEAPLAETFVEQATEVASVAAEVVAPEPAARDLADELELSIGNAPVARVAPRTPQWAAASIRLPLANFNAPRKQEQPAENVTPVEQSHAETPAEPELEIVPALDIRSSELEHDFEQPSALGFPAEQDRHEDLAPEQHALAPQAVVEAPIFDLVAAAEHGDVQADAALTEPAYETQSVDDFDDLLADVSRYPVPLRGEPVEAKAEPNFGSISVQPPIATAVAVPEPVAAPVEPLAEEVEPVTAGSEDPFADHDFDFDFAGIEMELAELDFTEAKKPAPEDVVADSQPPAAIPTPQRSMATPLAAPRAAQAVRPELAARPASAPILTLPPAPPVAAAVVAPKAPLPAFDSEQPLPFDPSEITETEDRLETFDGMNVPVLPHVEKEEPVAVPPEYDFDIDAELANLFNPPAKEATRQAVKSSSAGDAAAAGSWSPDSSAKTAAGKSGEELDEFERALEEDFRRSFSEPQQPAPDNVARMTLESSSETTDRRRARSMRGIAAAAAAVLVLGAGAYGVYGFLFHGSSLGLSSGEPRVITADKEPIKVVPENPGGKVVPNQDKAVYDRVAGDATQAPKQKQLVSSNEQPVDVVQKTLIPEAMSPDDNDDGAGDGNDVTATPVGETEDPRLLPGQSNSTDTAAAASDQENAPSVSPRKVRTMIVKPDGTLVARDEPAPAVDNSVKAPAPTVAKSQPSRPAAPAATADVAPTGKLASTDLRATNSDNAPASSALADAADSDAASAESTPIRVVKTTKIGDTAPAAAQASDTAPVPASRPAQPAVAPKVAPAPKQTQVADAVAPPAAKPVVPVAPAPKQPVAAAPVQKQVASAATAATSAGGYVMQIASLPSEEEAKRSQANLMSKFGSVIGGHAIEIRKADIAGKGTYYRVRVAAGSKDDAAALCVRFRAAGGTCLISK